MPPLHYRFGRRPRAAAAPCYHRQRVKSGYAFLFDMDGVIVHSMPLHNEAWRLYLADHGIHLEPAEIDARMHGKHNADCVRAFFGGDVTDDQIRLHGTEKEKIYRNLMRPRLREHLVAGIGEFLDRYRGTPMAVASNAEPANVSFVLDGAGLRDHFSAVLDGSQVARPKPDPEIYERAAAALGIQPSACVVFEDSAAGIEAARSAGALVAGIATTCAELPGAGVTVPDFRAAELHSWLQALLPI